MTVPGPGHAGVSDGDGFLSVGLFLAAGPLILEILTFTRFIDWFSARQ